MTIQTSKTKIYLAGPMEKEHGIVSMAKWRSTIIDACPQCDFLYPEQLELSHDAKHDATEYIPMQCVRMVAKCDLIIAIVDTINRFGTFCEISAAYAYDKPIELFSLFCSDENGEPKVCAPWFVRCLTSYIYTVSSIDEALTKIIAKHGGVNYYEYIKSPEWKSRADAAKERAGHRCQVCNSPENLNAHHRTYANLGNEQPDDLFVLCRSCHKLFSDNGKLAK